MPSYTKYYGLGFFDFGDRWGTDFSAEIEESRWIWLDKQLFGLMSIFGNGVIEGWTVTKADEALAIEISAGYGHINYVAGRTTYGSSISGLAPLSYNYIYAALNDSTFATETVEFVVSTSSSSTDPNLLLLAEVKTNATSITEIDNTVRQDIGFLQLIQAAIRSHKHRGGSLHPSKIDLESEVKGQLPSFRIEDFDAEKVSTGTFDLNRLPSIDHSDLDNAGILTHAQLDSFVKALQANNTELFGEVGGSLLLQIIIGLKRMFDDTDSPFYVADGPFDKTWPNELAILPGISPNSFIDFDNTTATVDLNNKYVQGVPPSVGTSFYVRYETELAWNSAYVLDDVTVGSSGVSLAFNESNEQNTLTVEDFEDATASGDELSGFEPQLVLLDDAASVTANSSSGNVISGFFTGAFQSQRTFRSEFKKEFSSAQDWSDYETLVVHVKCMDDLHGPVMFFMVGGSVADEDRPEWVVLDQNEITSNADATMNDYRVLTIDLSTISFRDQVSTIGFYTDDLENEFTFLVDYIYLQRSILLPEDGMVKLRYASPTSVTFSSIQWTTTEPSGTEITVRARVANSTALLNRSDYTPYLTSGDLINLDGSDIEIEIMLQPNTTRTLSPSISSLRILVTADAEIDGYAIDTQDEFARGNEENITVSSTPTLTLTSPVYVDSYYYCSDNAVHQGQAFSDEDETYTIDELAVFGTNTPIAPNSVLKAVEDGDSSISMGRLFEPRSVVRQVDRTYVIADTYNDRVLQLDEDGEVQSGFGSINYKHSTKVFPIAAACDSRTGILYVVFSKRINFKNVDVSKITIQNSATQITLYEDSDKIMGLTMQELSSVNAEGQILPIHLTEQNAALVSQLTGNCYILLSETVLTSGLDLDSIFYTTLATSLGIPIFIGNFAYIDGIFSPTYANLTTDDGYLVANAKVAVKEYDFTNADESMSKDTSVSSVIEIDSSGSIIFADDLIDFSPFIPGRIKQISTNRWLIGGLRPNGVESTPDSSHPFNFRTVFGGNDENNRKTQKMTQLATLSQIFFGINNQASSPFYGAVLLYDTNSETTLFSYQSPDGMLVSDVTVDPVTGYYVVAESSFDRSGRVLKLDSNGNIVFSFGEGLYTLINDVEVQNDGSFVIST